MPLYSQKLWAKHKKNHSFTAIAHHLWFKGTPQLRGSLRNTSRKVYGWRLLSRQLLGGAIAPAVIYAVDVNADSISCQCTKMIGYFKYQYVDWIFRLNKMVWKSFQKDHEFCRINNWKSLACIEHERRGDAKQGIVLNNTKDIFYCNACF